MEEDMNSFFNCYNNYNKQSNIEEVSSGDFATLQKARNDLIGEISAVVQYDEHIHNSQDKSARMTWTDIKNEELVHVGELLALINHLDPSQKQFVQKGIEEFNERMKS